MANQEAASTPSSNNEESNESKAMTLAKLAIAFVLVISATQTYNSNAVKQISKSSSSSVMHARRRLDAIAGNVMPSYMNPLFDELRARKKLFDDTPEKEIKYWFEYTGALQKYYYRYSKSRGKADYFEGRDDSGVISARFVDEAGGGSDFKSFFDSKSSEDAIYQRRLLDNCQSMGAASRAMTTKGSIWYDWFGENGEDVELERCRVLFVMNTVGAGKGTTILWETPPPIPHVSGPEPWMSEQETAAMHLERSLEEIDAMCTSGLVAARVQVLVCEPIPAVWTDWMDSKLVNCGGKPAPLEEELENPYEKGVDVEERASPVQVVVVASQDTADSCHDLKSGFMEQRMQDLVLAPPYLGQADKDVQDFDPAVKTTHPDLVSSDDHDVYIAMKWSSLVTLRTLSAFLQSSADLAAATQSPSKPQPDVALSNLLIPSFVRVSYVSEENNKVAKWRMHGDFFHPAAWEVCKESYNTTWIPHSISSTKKSAITACTGKDKSCGQYWIYFQEEQMPTSPEVFANQASPPLIRGGSNFIWALTEQQRKEVVSIKVCHHKNPNQSDACPADPQGVLPLGDLESFLINFMPNTALGKKHEKDNRPGYTHLEQMETDRERVAERKQLKGQEDIEKALFDYTVYPAALFHKDATVKATRNRDSFLNSKQETGPQSIKSAYFDVTITKPRDPTLSWCQNISRRGLCVLFSDYIRESKDETCWEACGMSRDFTKLTQ